MLILSDGVSLLNLSPFSADSAGFFAFCSSALSFCHGVSGKG